MLIQKSIESNHLSKEKSFISSPNILKRKLIDPKVTPETELNGTRLGGQSVLIQSINPKYRNLKLSIFINT